MGHGMDGGMKKDGGTGGAGLGGAGDAGKMEEQNLPNMGGGSSTGQGGGSYGP
jgi:hypothetical protein